MTVSWWSDGAAQKLLVFAINVTSTWKGLLWSPRELNLYTFGEVVPPCFRYPTNLKPNWWCSPLDKSQTATRLEKPFQWSIFWHDGCLCKGKRRQSAQLHLQSWKRPDALWLPIDKNHLSARGRLFWQYSKPDSGEDSDSWIEGTWSSGRPE